jgi:hypothetical protein
MKKQTLLFGLKSKFILFLLVSITLGVSFSYVQALHAVPEGVQSEKEADVDIVYDAWMLAVRYRFEETAEEYPVAHDPTIMEMIASLRGDELRYFLDSIEAINQVQTIMFPPSFPEVEQTNGLALPKERELVEIVTDVVFSKGGEDADLTQLGKQEQAYILELQTILEAIVKGNGDTFFNTEYLEYRARIIPFIEDTNAELFNPSQEAVDSYMNYFGIDDEQSNDLDLNRTLASCSTTNTIDNWPSKSSIYSGNTGSAWYEGKASDQNDCDLWVRYYMGPAPHYGQISAGTSSAQCVLDKTSQLRGDWSGSMIYNYVQYGKNTVTWWWPLGCNTTGSALMSATKWRP